MKNLFNSRFLFYFIFLLISKKLQITGSELTLDILPLFPNITKTSLLISQISPICHSELEIKESVTLVEELSDKSDFGPKEFSDQNFDSFSAPDSSQAERFSDQNLDSFSAANSSQTKEFSERSVDIISVSSFQPSNYFSAQGKRFLEIDERSFYFQSYKDYLSLLQFDPSSIQDLKSVKQLFFREEGGIVEELKNLKKFSCVEEDSDEKFDTEEDSYDDDEFEISEEDYLDDQELKTLRDRFEQEFDEFEQILNEFELEFERV